MLDLAMPDPRRLQHAVAGAQRAPALPLVFEGGPALQDVHRLEVEGVGVPLRHRMLAGNGADDMGVIPAVGRVLDAEIAVLEELAQAIGDRKSTRLNSSH